MRIPYKNNDAGCGTVLAIILVAIGLLFFMNWIGWLLWGAIAVAIFSLPALSYWQFWGLSILCHILFIGTRVSSSSKD
jgi:hypothetical protein